MWYASFCLRKNVFQMERVTITCQVYYIDLYIYFFACVHLRALTAKFPGTFNSFRIRNGKQPHAEKYMICHGKQYL